MLTRWLTVGLQDILKWGQVCRKARVVRVGAFGPTLGLGGGEGRLDIELHNLDSDSESCWVGEHIKMLEGLCTQRGLGGLHPLPIPSLFISSTEPFLSYILY